MRISEAFRSPECQVNGAVMFVDMTGSTSLKERQSEPNWLQTLGSFLDLVMETISQNGDGKVVKFLGDGVMAIYDEDHITDAINAAIALQQRLQEQRREKGIDADCYCTIGVASGKFYKADTPNGLTDYFGLVVDKAARLCSYASPSAIFADIEAVNNVLWRKVSSEVGRVLNREGPEYKGPVNKAILKGFSHPVEFHEILWARERFGVKSSEATQAVEQAAAKAALHPAPYQAFSSRAPEWRSGIVKTWIGEKHFGFISSDDGIDYFCNSNMTVSRRDLALGERVLFIPKPPKKENANPATGCVLTINELISAEIQTTNIEKGFGFAKIEDADGNNAQLFIYAGSAIGSLKVGSRYQFLIDKNPKGAIGRIHNEAQDNKGI